MKLIAVIALLFTATNAQAANVSIIGEWRTENGDIAEIGPCDNGISLATKDMPDICVRLMTGPNAGSFIGSGKKELARAGRHGARFKGELTDPVTKYTYRGFGEIKGGTLLVSGCYLVLCEKQVWRKLYSPDGRAD